MLFKRTPAKILTQDNPRAAVAGLVARMDRSRIWAQLTPPEQRLLLLSQLRSETLNGTVEQYLTNSSGDHLNAALSALEDVGASECAAVLREVCAWFPESQPSQDREARCRQLFDFQSQHPEHEAEVRRITDDLAAHFPRMLELLVAHLRDHATELG